MVSTIGPIEGPILRIYTHGVAEAAIERGVFELLCEEVGAVQLAGDVCDEHMGASLSLADLVFAKIKVLDAFRRDCCGPVDTGHVVVVDRGLVGRVDDGDVLGAIFDREEFFDTFICCDYFGFGRALCCLVLAEAFPGNGTARAAYYVS